MLKWESTGDIGLEAIVDGGYYRVSHEKGDRSGPTGYGAFFYAPDKSISLGFYPSRSNRAARDQAIAACEQHAQYVTNTAIPPGPVGG